MCLTLKKKNLINLSSAPKAIVFHLSNLGLIDDWSKSLEGMPLFFIEHIDSYYQKIYTAVLSKSKKLKKHFSRGE